MSGSNNNDGYHGMISNTLGSAVAGIVSRTFTHPIDTAKSRLQAQYSVTSASSSSVTPQYRGTVDVLQKTFRTEGIRGLYRGFGAILVGGTPGTVTYLCTYEFAKDSLSSAMKGQDDSSYNNNDQGGDFLIHFSAGMIAETIACIIYVPVDVIKERLQVQHAASSSNNSASSNYQGSYDALKKIAKTEGLSGIYKGYAATLASFGPFSALYFMFYERFKSETRFYLFDPQRIQPKTTIDKKEIPFPWLVLCSSSAGGLASWLTSPLDMAKLRLQVQRGENAVASSSSSSLVSYRGVVDCLQTVYRQGGMRGLFRGAGARVCFYAPATTITMSCYETCRSFVAKLLVAEDR
ncbi:Mitochondrial aspartate-glutamate transporter AGC1 [Seminavis robusta]|uniref:Mitochondrial aspartate-glutamate transporter AGC1 n=1 Tax=Seminavis robusta TaxID=568900 RepID=A0A9N8DLE5_9STRA|nr:Mitochondrial aspartate-glutamate transporter AGC1 [Seminavis robusta]|eukprot:Sro206_g086630.1 Mitochondrial aspartate-glutamate transporter AGC1 (350) ;mRNA; f:60937-61986